MSSRLVLQVDKDAAFGVSNKRVPQSWHRPANVELADARIFTCNLHACEDIVAHRIGNDAAIKTVVAIQIFTNIQSPVPIKVFRERPEQTTVQVMNSGTIVEVSTKGIT